MRFNITIPSRARDSWRAVLVRAIRVRCPVNERDVRRALYVASTQRHPDTDVGQLDAHEPPEQLDSYRQDDRGGRIGNLVGQARVQRLAGDEVGEKLSPVGDLAPLEGEAMARQAVVPGRPLRRVAVEAEPDGETLARSRFPVRCQDRVLDVGQ